MFKRAIVVLVVLTGFICSVLYFLFFKPVYVRTEYSLNNTYSLKIYREQRWFTMPGDGGSSCASFKLYKGHKRIYHDLDDCSAFINNLEIDWDLDNCIVWVARGKGIYLEQEDCKY